MAAPGTDPLTSVEALTAMIEPGFRMIDGTLLKQLYERAHRPAIAATIEPGFRLIDNQLLRDLARIIEADRLAEVFRLTQDPGKRLLDGVPWKELAEEEMEREPIQPAMGAIQSGTIVSSSPPGAQVESVRSTGEGGGAAGEGSGQLPNPR